MTWAGVEANFTGSHSWGPFDVALDSGGRMIGDGVGSTVIEGTSGNDVLMGFIGSDELLGKGGDDRLYGGPGVDVLVGGEGNDSISGDEGADYLFDRGSDDPEAGIADQYAYDGAGDDTLDGGEGSDILFYSGGNDTFYGGVGDDTYIISPELLPNRTAEDRLTIVLAEDPADEETWFGHDYVVGNGAGIHQIVFEGLNRNDVTFTYEYTVTPFDEMDAATQTYFMNLLGISELNLGTFPIFSLTGKLAITVNATGSSILFDTVTGAYVGGNNTPGGNIYVPPIILTQTNAVFEDGTFYNWANQVGFPGGIIPINGTLPDAAEDAPESQAEELSEPQIGPRRILRIATDDGGPLYGSNGHDALYGRAGNDSLVALNGNDLLGGSVGADVMDGGDGIDLVDYGQCSGKRAHREYGCKHTSRSRGE